MTTIQEVIQLLSKYQFSLDTEEALKIQMAEVLTANGVPFIKEHFLDKKNKPDFLIFDFAIECKISGSAKSIYRQCLRYCEFPAVKGLVLITNKALGFPEELNGKPAYVVNTGKSWL